MMMNFRKLGTALTLAGFVATGMFASAARVEAAGPGPNHGICQVLQKAHDAAVAAGLTDAAASAQSYAASIGCAWAQ
jgi:hypothetical protein